MFFKNYILLNFQGYVTVQLSRFFVISFALLRQLLYFITVSFVCQPLFHLFLKKFKSYNCLNCSSSSINFIGDSEYNTPLPPDCQLLFSSFFCFLISTFNSVFDAQFHRPEHRLPQRHSESQYRPSSGWRQCSHTSLLPGG